MPASAGMHKAAARPVTIHSRTCHSSHPITSQRYFPQSKSPTLEKCPFPALKFDQHCTWIHLPDCDMPATHTTLTHPSHHPPNSIPAPADAAQPNLQPNEESAPFTEVVGRGKKSNKPQPKRGPPLQTTLTFAGASAPPSTSPAPVVSVDIASRVEETTKGIAASGGVEQRSADRTAAPAATADITEIDRLDPLTSSSRATQHSSPSLSAARSPDAALRATRDGSPTPSTARQHGSLYSPPPFTSSVRPREAQHDSDRMSDIAAAKRARELSKAPSRSATRAVVPASSGYIHPSRQQPMDCGADTSSMAPHASDKEEADPGDGQDKRRRTTPVDDRPLRSSLTSSPSSAEPTTRNSPPTLEEFNMVVTELRASQREASELRARLEQLERRIGASFTPSLPATAPPAPGSSAVTAVQDDMRVAASRMPEVLTSSSQPANVARAAAASADSRRASARPISSRNQRAHQYPLAEPKAALLSSLSLSPYSSTDLMLDIRLPPLAIKMARGGRFPNHATQPANHRIGIVNLLQGANGVQLQPPRVPLFVTSVRGEGDSVAALQQSHAPDSRECRYLDSIRQAATNGDDFDPCQHSFADSECVSSWHQLLTLDTRIVSSQHQRRLHIRLALLNPLLTAAVTASVAAHMQHVQLSLAAWQTKHPAAARGSGMASPTPSVTSTASSDSTDQLSPTHTSAMDEDTESPAGDNRHLARLREGAMHSAVSVSPYRLQYATCTISNWPRAHPTELCGSNSLLTAFVRQHAPDVRLVTRDENGMTSASVTAYCQKRHLPQLVALNGRVSEQHGIHFPLQLHSTIHVMGAKTCTFCWQPSHGASRCPHRTTSLEPALPSSTHPACRHCYSFAHQSDACTSTAAKVCTLCKKDAHCTWQCSHFFPSRLPLHQYLTPPPSKQQQQQRVAAEGKSGVSAPILSNAHTAATRPWQTDNATSAALPPAGLAHTLLPPAQHEQATPSAAFVTPGQLEATLAPILALLQQILGSRLFAEAASMVHMPLTASAAITSLSPSTVWRAPACTATRINEQPVLAH